jgi:hypothetical protein
MVEDLRHEGRKIVLKSGGERKDAHSMAGAGKHIRALRAVTGLGMTKPAGKRGQLLQKSAPRPSQQHQHHVCSRATTMRPIGVQGHSSAIRLDSNIPLTCVCATRGVKDLYHDFAMPI